MSGLARRLLNALAGLLALASVGACDFDPSGTASFLDSDFGTPTARVLELDDAGVEAVMRVAVGRFRAYSQLRAALPFQVVANSPCRVESQDGAGAILIATPMACALGAGASGIITLRQQQVATAPVEVFEFLIAYEDVVVPGVLSVSGTETITETIDASGASVHDLDLRQDGVLHRYTFRNGLLDANTPVFDYTVTTSAGEVVVRMTNPTAPGAFATIFLGGIDGRLTCELRDSDWALSPRGICDNGAVFGLP